MQIMKGSAMSTPHWKTQVMNRARELQKKLEAILPEADDPSQKTEPTIADNKPTTNIPATGRPAPQKVDGGIVYKIDLTPAEYKAQTDRMTHLTKINSKRWNSVFSIHQPIGKKDVFHLFHLYFSKSDFVAGATNPERAERIKYIGQFNSKEAALNYVKSAAVPGSAFSLEKDIEAGGGKQNWSAKELGV